MRPTTSDATLTRSSRFTVPVNSTLNACSVGTGRNTWMVGCAFSDATSEAGAALHAAGRPCEEQGYRDQEQNQGQLRVAAPFGAAGTVSGGVRFFCHFHVPRLKPGRFARGRPASSPRVFPRCSACLRGPRRGRCLLRDARSRVLTVTGFRNLTLLGTEWDSAWDNAASQRDCPSCSGSRGPPAKRKA